MSSTERMISTADALVTASKDQAVRTLVVSGNLIDVAEFRLLPGHCSNSPIPWRPEHVWQTFPSCARAPASERTSDKHRNDRGAAV